MNHRYKSTPQDDRTVRDEQADIAERGAAMTRLVVDQCYEFEPLLAQWLTHPSHHLRAQAVTLVLGMWHLARYFEITVQMLHTDEEWLVRADAAFALGSYARHTPAARERVIRELVQCVRHDAYGGVQKRCYKELLRLLMPGRRNFDLPDDFDRERDVDWALLRPYLEELILP